MFKKYLSWLLLFAVLCLPIQTWASQHDMDITAADANTGSTFRAAINEALKALASTNSGDSEPPVTWAGMLWADTLNGKLKMRNISNDGWNEIYTLTGGISAFAYTLLDDTTAREALTTLNTLPITSGAISYAGDQILSGLVLKMGTTNTKIAHSAFSCVIAGGSVIDKTADYTGLTLPSGTIPTNKWGIFRLSMDSYSVVTITAGADNYTTGYVDETSAIAALPSTPAGEIDLGYFTVLTASGYSFVCGTDALQGGTGGHPSADTNYYAVTPTNDYSATLSPVPPDYSGVYYLKATSKNYLAEPTINLNSLGAKTIKKAGGAALSANDITDNHVMNLRYDGTDFILANPNVQVPPGTIITYAGTSCPAGTMEADGSAINRTTYSNLYAVIGVIYGSGDGTYTFNLPDYRGQFLRGWAHGSTNDPDRASRINRGDGTTGDYVGTKQGHQFYSHTHTFTPTPGSIPYGQGSGGSTYGFDYTPTYGATVNYSVGGTGSISASGGNETRPININVLYCIKY